MTRGTLYPMTLKGNVNLWNDMIVIVETIPELCGDEVQSKEVDGYIEEIKNALITQRFVYDIRETISITKASFEQRFGHVLVYVVTFGTTLYVITFK